MASSFAIKAILIAFVLMPGIARAESKTESLDRLVRAYPDALTGHDEKYIFWRDGTVMPADDSVSQKSFDDLLRKASIMDQLSLSYPRGNSSPPAPNDDPGRFRNEAFFKKMYGDCNAGEVKKNLVTITWLPRSWGSR
jgi:hypothetical protein